MPCPPAPGPAGVNPRREEITTGAGAWSTRPVGVTATSDGHHRHDPFRVVDQVQRPDSPRRVLRSSSNGASSCLPNRYGFPATGPVKCSNSTTAAGAGNRSIPRRAAAVNTTM
jgi:hypothetical protein